jgi:hypothetical protein
MLWWKSGIQPNPYAGGSKFALERKKANADLTKEMLADGSWRVEEFKSYNLVPGAGAPPNGGHVHPLLKVGAVQVELSRPTA